MGHKISPKAFRIGIIKNWDSRWFTKMKKIPAMLEEDLKVRNYIKKLLKPAGLEKVDIERLGSNISVLISAARPGVIIGRGGKGIEKIKGDLDKLIRQHRQEKKIKEAYNLNITIEEVRSPLASAAIVGQMLAEEIEKRAPYRRTMKKMIEQVSQQKEVKGVKVRLSGRLDGAEISRREWLDFGKMPLQTLRADIDYAEVRAQCTYGTIGIKVWIYKGEVFSDDQGKKR